MTLETMLREAFDGEAGFEPEDLETRVRHRRNRRRAAAGAGSLVLVALAFVGARALLADDDSSQVIAGPPVEEPQPVPITADALVGSRWVAVGGDGNPIPWVSFHEDGTWSATTECQRISGGWNLGGRRLRLTETGGGRDIGCPTRFALAGSATLFDDGGLRFEALDERPAVVVDFRRLDRVGVVATEEDLAGEWITADGAQMWELPNHPGC